MTDYLGDPGPVDEISQDSGFALPGRSRLPGAMTPGAKLTALTTALALVLTGGVVTAAWRAFQSHDGPEQLVPSSAFGIATLDLSMRGHDDALSTFANHFPHSPTHHGDGSAADRLLRAIFRGSSDPHVDYDHDIKPWLGDRVAIAGWMDKAGKPEMEGLIESSDDGAARDELTKLFKDGDGAFDFADGYVVIGDTKALVRESIDAAHRQSLADNATYAADIDALPGEPALTGWLDGPGARKALEAALGPDEAKMLEQLGGAGPFGMLGPMGLAGSAGMVGAGAVGSANAGAVGGPSPVFTGRTTMGVQVTDRYLEIDSRATDSNPQRQASTQTLRALPASTIAAFEVGDPAPIVSGVTSMLKEFFGLPTDLTSEGACSMSVGPLNSGPLTRRQMRALRRKAIVRAQRPSACKDTQPPPAPPDPLKEIEKATGLQLPGDATTVLGDSLLASYGGLSLQGMPKVALRTHPSNLSAAQDVLERVQTHVGASSPVPFTDDASGDDLVLATSIDYAHEVEQRGSFGQQSQVALALGEVPGEVETAGYVDLSKILPLLGAVPKDVQALKAVGFWTTLDGGVQRSQLRVVVG